MIILNLPQLQHITHNHDKDKDNNHVKMFNNHNNDGDHYNDDCVKK